MSQQNERSQFVTNPPHAVQGMITVGEGVPVEHTYQHAKEAARDIGGMVIGSPDSVAAAARRSAGEVHTQAERGAAVGQEAVYAAGVIGAPEDVAAHPAAVLGRQPYVGTHRAE